MRLLEGLARNLAEGGLGLTWRDTGAYAEFEIGLAIEQLPSSPSKVVGLFRYPGIESDSKLPYDEPSVQVRVRGTEDVRMSSDLAQDIYDYWHGRGPVTLSNEIYVVSIIGRQGSPISIGRDEQGRHEHTVNFAVHYLNVTTLRR